MDRRIADLANCVEICGSDFGLLCNHVGFLDRYDWGYTCGNCGAAFQFKEKITGEEECQNPKRIR